MLKSLLKGLGISGGGALAVMLLELVMPEVISKLDPKMAAIAAAAFANVINFLKLKYVDGK